MLLKLSRFSFLLAIIVACGLSTSARAGSLIQNGGFDTPTPGLSPPNYPTSISGAPASGPASAEFWTLDNNFDATTSTELLTSTDPSGGGFMIHVTSTPTSGSFSFFNGLQQAFATQSGATTASVDVDVLSGVVIVALFANDGGTFIGETASTVNNQWQTLTFTAPAGTNPNLIAIYTDNGTANTVGEFYADNASVTAASVPEPASGVLAVIGISATALWVRRARPRSGTRRAGPSA